jgi:hypothetical protein
LNKTHEEYVITRTPSGGYKAVCSRCGFVAIAMSLKTAVQMIEKHIRETHK